MKYESTYLPARQKTEKGFTLIELLLVVAIIGVLATFSMVNFIGVRQRARDAQRKSDIEQLRSAFEIYRSDQASYPPSPLPNCGASLTAPAPATGTVYLQKSPCDPITNAKYNYSVTGSPPRAYTLVACLENSNDSQKDATKNSSCNTASYTLTNP